MSQELLTELQNLLGETQVLINEQDRKTYEGDRTGRFSGQALAVVRPANTQEVADVMRLATQHNTPVIPMGGNTGLSGGCYPGEERNSLILTLERMTAIGDINTHARTVVVGAGAILENIHNAVEAKDLVFPLTFGAKGSCRIGGNLSTNAGGSNVLRYGNTRALCLGLEVVTANGEIMDLMSSLHKDNTGYDLKDLFIGAEGTLGIITAAVLKLFPKPDDYATAMVALSGLDAALELLNELNDRSAGAVEAFEYMPDNYFRYYAQAFPDRGKLLDDPAPINVMIELGMNKKNAGESGATGLLEAVLAEGFEDGRISDATIAQNDAQRQAMWQCREAALDVSMTKGKMAMTDISLPLDQVPVFLEKIEPRVQAIAPGAEAFVISHLGDGNVHYGVWLDPERKGINRDKNDKLVEEIEALTNDLKGSFSAEHGIGVYKLSSMDRNKDPIALAMMRQIKAALDPNNLLNPGKVIPA